jgi:hypothetical protein
MAAAKQVMTLSAGLSGSEAETEVSMNLSHEQASISAVCFRNCKGEHLLEPPSFHSAQMEAASNAPPGGLLLQEADGHLLVRAHSPNQSTQAESSISFLFSAPKEKLEEIYAKLHAGTSLEI